MDEILVKRTLMETTGSQRPGQSVMQAQVGEVTIDSSEDEIEVRLTQVFRRLEGHPSFHVPVATKPVGIAWKPSVSVNCASCLQNCGAGTAPGGFSR